MQAVLPFPDISPELFSIDFGFFTFALRWYALAYIVGIIIAWRMVIWMIRRPALWPGNTAPITPEQIEDLVTWIVLGVIAGGRLTYVIFYDPMTYIANPLLIPQIWEGGMSFHGGMMGVFFAILFYCRRYDIPAFSVGDSICVATPPALLLGRTANFINAELWGRPSDAPWAVIFPGEVASNCAGFAPDMCARHPSQLYEAGLEGLVLGILLFTLMRLGALKLPKLLTGLFFLGYGAARMFVELFREADPQFITALNPEGHVIQLGAYGLSMGQLLSLPMVLFGLLLITLAFRQR